MQKNDHLQVHDRIPELIRQNGEHAEVIVLDLSDYQQALRSKCPFLQRAGLMVHSLESLGHFPRASSNVWKPLFT